MARATVYRYFPSKEDVVFYDFDVIFDAIRQRIDERGADETTMDACLIAAVGWILIFFIILPASRHSSPISPPL